MLVVVAPWVIRNLTTFERPVLLSTNMDSVASGANCHESYYGASIGSWRFDCLPEGDLPEDEAEEGAVLRRRGFDYARDHLERVPLVVAARVGRAWDVFRPLQYPSDSGREPWVARLSVASFYSLMPLGVAGAILLYRRRGLVLPLVMQAAIVTIVAAVAYRSGPATG
jgi:hypothetical protein